jgi:tRNA 2-thiouridine synthesizing protein E
MTGSGPLRDLFDDRGFVTDPDLWDRDLALGIAADLGIGELTETHWRVVDHIRGAYLSRRTLPWMSHVCRELGLDRDCFHRLFGGPVEAWKVAGLPDPGPEARTYMENEEP